VINSFSGQYRFLSNFAPALVRLDGERYPTVEHAYQAAKTLDPQARVPFQTTTRTPGQAKRLGRRLVLRSDWEEVKVSTMLKLLRQKFCRKSENARLLLETLDEELVEGNTWGDTFWGVCDGKGKNMLGRLLMHVRNELQLTEGV
jgi:N-glycosidase YbiA